MTPNKFTSARLNEFDVLIENLIWIIHILFFCQSNTYSDNINPVDDCFFVYVKAVVSSFLEIQSQRIIVSFRVLTTMHPVRGILLCDGFMLNHHFCPYYRFANRTSRPKLSIGLAKPQQRQTPKTTEISGEQPISNQFSFLANVALLFYQRIVWDSGMVYRI